MVWGFMKSAYSFTHDIVQANDIVMWRRALRRLSCVDYNTNKMVMGHEYTVCIQDLVFKLP